MAKTLSEQEILRLARLGALARLRELEDEAQAIRRMFPGLEATEGSQQAPKAERKAKGRKGGRHMSPEARKAAAERMKAYWARKKGLAQVSAEGEVTSEAAAESAADAPRKPRGRKARARRSRGRKRG